MGGSFPISVIYCKSVQWIGYGYEMARQILEDSFYAGEETPENARVVMFHSSMEDSSGKVTTCINYTKMKQSTVVPYLTQHCQPHLKWS